MPNRQQQQERLIERRSKPMIRALQNWMLKRAREEAARQTKLLRLKKGGKGYTVAKRYELISKAEGIDEELLAILMRFGVAQATDASFRVGSMSGVDRILNPKRLKAALTDKRFKLKIFTELEGWATKRVREVEIETRKLVKESIMSLLTDAADEDVLPSTGEIARRIRTTFHSEKVGNRIYAWSPERAALIARTELAQAENTAAFQTYGLIDKTAREKGYYSVVRWLAKTGDRRSGKRRHWKMHGKEVKVGEAFILPSGARGKHPGDPALPIGDLANCRCGHRIVLKKIEG